MTVLFLVCFGHDTTDVGGFGPIGGRLAPRVTKFAAGPWVGVELERGVGACLGVAFRSVAFRPIHVDVDGTISGC